MINAVPLKKNMMKSEARSRRVRSFIIDTVLLVFSSAVCAVTLLRFITP
jgi:hypothetical protein